MKILSNKTDLNFVELIWIHEFFVVPLSLVPRNFSLMDYHNLMLHLKMVKMVNISYDIHGFAKSENPTFDAKNVIFRC